MKAEMNNKIDILENEILHDYPDVMAELLCDHTTGRNIFWATNDYEALGDGYDFYSEIKIEAITGDNGQVIKPRVLKTKENQKGRAQKMAEIFTPSWICNAQINAVDNDWLGCENLFNVVSEDQRTWEATTQPITFPEDKTWEDYVYSPRLEITCGEAPYIVSRYDTTTGEFIQIQQRIGMLDRKLRVVNENTQTREEWLKMAEVAYKNIYGYEWQGDSLLLARENLLVTFIEYYQDRFGEKPSIESIQNIAHIVSWNLWQMDGLKFVIPKSCGDKEVVTEDIFGNKKVHIKPCMGCKKGDYYQHNGIYCKIMDWYQGKPIEFVSLLKKKKK